MKQEITRRRCNNVLRRTSEDLIRLPLRFDEKVKTKIFERLILEGIVRICIYIFF